MPRDTVEEFHLLLPMTAKALPVGLQRLLTLADFLETQVPREHYDMREFYHECGAASCALGWAEHVPGFREQGYTYAGYHLATRFFDFKGDEALQLFNGPEHRGERPHETAARIREFISSRLAEIEG